MDAIRQKLVGIEERYNEINDLLMDENIVKDPKKLTKLSKEQARLKQSVDAWHELKDLDDRLAQAEELLKENDPELKEMAQLEKEECEPKQEELLVHIQKLLVPRDPEDECDVIMEIRGGAGGDEGNSLCW